VWVTPCPLAVMVTFEVPAVAVLLAVKVRVELPLPGAGIVSGLKLPVTPSGRPEIESDTSLLKSLAAAVVTVTLLDVPWIIERLVAEAVSVKPAPGVTVSGSVVVRVLPNPVAMMVTFVVSAATLLSAVKVRVELPLPGNGILPGSKVAVTPAGKPETDKDMEASKL